jgi:hypothetical protein
MACRKRRGQARTSDAPQANLLTSPLLRTCAIVFPQLMGILQWNESSRVPLKEEKGIIE